MLATIDTLDDVTPALAAIGARARERPAPAMWGSPLKPIPGLPGYFITRSGQPYGPSGPIGTYPYRKRTGYTVMLFCVNLPRRSGSRGSRRYRVARAVLLAHEGEPPPGKTLACHIDGDSLNCRGENLYWGDAIDNARDRLRHEQQYEAERSGRRPCA